jgi:hypothetical protein
MTAPHVQLNDDGSIQLRLSPEDAKILASHDTVKVLAFQDRFRSELFIAEAEAALRSEAVS